MEYIEWLKNSLKKDGEKLSESSAYKYDYGVKVISEEMLKKGTIDKSLYQMSLYEIDIAIAIIFKDKQFIEKNKRGNSMYSNALKRYRCYKYFDTEESMREIEEENRIKEDKTLSVTEKESIIKARVGQGEYRKKLLKKYKRCIITGIDIPQVLIASHIKPWAVCDNNDRISANNGLMLSATYDKLFDSGLISFEKSGRILISSLISKENKKKLNISSGEIYDIGYTCEMDNYLKYHNDVIFVK